MTSEKPIARVVFFTRYSRLGPSSRLRSFQYKPLLEARGYEVLTLPLFNDRYIKDLYASVPTKNRWNAVKCYIRRFWHILRYVRRDSHIIIEKELLPYFPSVIERLMHRTGIKYMVDIDDAIFHYYDTLKNPLLKLFLSGKVDNVFKHSSVVLAGNQFLADRARSAGAQHIVNFPTVIDTQAYKSQSEAAIAKKSPEASLVVGWIGSPGSVRFFGRIIPMLDELSKEVDFLLRIVGSNIRFKVQNMKVEYFDWSEEKEVALINSFDIGLMALEPTPFEKGKCGYKLIQYFGCSKPVVASPVGVNQTIVEHGRNGFLAVSDLEWKTSLSTLLNDERLRIKMGNEGYKKVIDYFDIHINLERFLKVMEEK